MEIRNASIEDTRDLQEIFDLRENFDKLERYSDSQLFAAIKNPANLFLVCVADARIQCFIWIIGLDDAIKGPKIEEFASRIPGAGCGSVLFRYAIKAILDRGHKRVWLAVAADNEKAIRFYARFGFVEKEVRKKVWSRRSGDIADGLMMEALSSELDASLKPRADLSVC